MKVSLNLSLAQSFRQRHVVAWSLPLLAASVLLLFRLGLSIESNWKEYRVVRQSVEREQARQNELAGQEAGLKNKLQQPENRALLREVQFVNSVIEQRRLSFTGLTEKVTVLLPPQVRLAALSLPDSSGDPVVHFGVEGTSEEPVETFLTNLEDSPDFKDVSLLSQGFEQKGNGVPVSITCTARYVGGRTEIAEDTKKAPKNVSADAKGGNAAATPAQAANSSARVPVPQKSGEGPVPAAGGANKPAGSVTPTSRRVPAPATKPK
jgi:Tfp pilus assembly protein PilN